MYRKTQERELGERQRDIQEGYCRERGVRQKVGDQPSDTVKVFLPFVPRCSLRYKRLSCV